MNPGHVQSLAMTHSTEIFASLEVIFEATQNYDRRLAWDPFLRRAELMDGADRADRGVRAYCQAWYGLGMVTEYVAYDPPRVAAVKMIKGPWFIQSFAGSWRFLKIDESRTKVTFRYTLCGRPNWPMTRIIGRQFSRDTVKRLEALKLWLERESR